MILFAHTRNETFSQFEPGNAPLVRGLVAKHAKQHNGCAKLGRVPTILLLNDG
jgi:hypothetical protein